jgi:arginine utilization protein RocB
MIKRLFAVLVLTAISACVHNDPHTRNIIKTDLRNKDGKLVAIFRNTGRQVVSFDYTLADKGNVVHVDADGPNSGLVSNLYPGEDREVSHPSQKSIIWPKIGAVTYGRRSIEELERIYKPISAAQAAQAAKMDLLPPPAAN